MFCKKSVVGYLFFLIAALTAAQVSGPRQNPAQSVQQQSSDLSSIVQRMEQAALANRDRYRAYVMTREYRMYGGSEQKPSSTVLADISFIPPATKDFKITEADGSTRGETVVRHILENEQKAAKTGQAPGAVSTDNYTFALQGEQNVDGHACYVLKLNPKRKEKNLVEGRAWVDKATYLVRRIEGEMAKMPSWWLKSVHVTLDFASAGGMWLQTHTEARADVRVFGVHTLTEDALKIRTGSTVAQLAPRPRSFRRTAAAIAAFER